MKISYYLAKLFSKIVLHTIGPMSVKYGILHKNYIVFKNRMLQDMTDNAAAFFEYLVQNEQYKNYKIIWMVSNKKEISCHNIYKNVKFITAESENGWTNPLAYYYGAIAGYFFYTNNTAYLNLYHCEGQITVNLWHGCGYKNVAKESHVVQKKKSMMHFDYALVPGEVFVNTKSKYWKCPKEKLLLLGYPRYDWMLHPSLKKTEIMQRIFSRNEHKVLIWMPTFRQSELIDSAEKHMKMPFVLPGLKNEEELQLLDAFLEKEQIFLIIKKHPLQSEWKLSEDKFHNIGFVTQKKLKQNNIQLYELLSICDGLLTDYSSVAVDYMLLNRPIGFVLSDMKQYENSRGFIFDNILDYMPGEKIYDLKGIQKFVKQIINGEDMFEEERRKLLPLMHCMPIKESYCYELANFLNL